MKHLSRKEIEMAGKMLETLGLSGNLNKCLEQQIKGITREQAEGIAAELEAGVEDFYAVYSKPVDQKEIRKLLEKNMEGMKKEKQYAYLSNVMVAQLHMCGNILEGRGWNEEIEEHATVLKGLELGFLDGQDEKIQSGIEKMLEMISENMDAASVLFIGEEPYQELFKACLEEEPKEIAALAANTKAGAVNMAAALYILQEQGELPSLKGTKIPPREMGIMASSLVEIDAAHKTGSMEKAKEMISKAARTAVVLLATSPDLWKDMAFVSFLGLLMNFNLLWILVAGAILWINVKARHKRMEEELEPLFNKGEKIANVCLDQVQKISGKIREWIQTDVLKSAIKVWKRCYDFAFNVILIPVAVFLVKAKDVVLQGAGIVREKVRSAYNHLKDRAADIAAEVNERTNVSREDSEEETGEFRVDFEEIEEARDGGVSEERGIILE